MVAGVTLHGDQIQKVTASNFTYNSFYASFTIMLPLLIAAELYNTYPYISGETDETIIVSSITLSTIFIIFVSFIETIYSRVFIHKSLMKKTLLNKIMPESIWSQLINDSSKGDDSSKGVKPQLHSCVTILFSDIKSFVNICSGKYSIIIIIIII
jgi:hypothetical protein